MPLSVMEEAFSAEKKAPFSDKPGMLSPRLNQFHFILKLTPFVKNAQKSPLSKYLGNAPLSKVMNIMILRE
jgi:hypothetical protein